jgi:cobalt/nickel transport system permease protein
MSTPAWLTQAEVGLCPCGCIGTRKKTNFIDRTITGSAVLLRRAMFADDVSSGAGLLQRIDARVKVMTLLGLLVATSLVHHVSVLVVMYLATLPLAVASRLSLGFFVKRVWLFIPIFTGVIVLPATFSFITGGDIVVPLGHWFGHRVGLTSQGLHSAALIITRVATSISLVVLLTLTTPWARLLAALRALHVPKMFVQVAGMAYRYLFHLLDSVTDMYTARKARTVGTASNTKASKAKEGRAFVGATAGALFGKAHALSDEVYSAMIARGYTGQARALDGFRMRSRDAVWTAGCVAAFAAVIWWDHVLGR